MKHFVNTMHAEISKKNIFKVNEKYSWTNMLCDPNVAPVT